MHHRTANAGTLSGSSSSASADVVVVGAGVAGLWAAAYKGADYYEYPVAHTVIGPSAHRLSNMVDAARTLEKRAKALGVRIRYRTPAVQLMRANDGRVNSVIAETNGERNRIMASR